MKTKKSAKNKKAAKKAAQMSKGTPPPQKQQSNGSHGKSPNGGVQARKSAPTTPTVTPREEKKSKALSKNLLGLKFMQRRSIGSSDSVADGKAKDDEKEASAHWVLPAASKSRRKIQLVSSFSSIERLEQGEGRMSYNKFNPDLEDSVKGETHEVKLNTKKSQRSKKEGGGSDKANTGKPGVFGARVTVVESPSTQASVAQKRRRADQEEYVAAALGSGTGKASKKKMKGKKKSRHG